MGSWAWYLKFSDVIRMYDFFFQETQELDEYSSWGCLNLEIFLFKFGFNAYKAEQSLQDMELQEKETKKD